MQVIFTIIEKKKIHIFLSGKTILILFKKNYLTNRTITHCYTFKYINKIVYVYQNTMKQVSFPTSIYVDGKKIYFYIKSGENVDEKEKVMKNYGFYYIYISSSIIYVFSTHTHTHKHTHTPTSYMMRRQRKYENHFYF